MWGTRIGDLPLPLRPNVKSLRVLQTSQNVSQTLFELHIQLELITVIPHASRDDISRLEQASLIPRTQLPHSTVFCRLSNHTRKHATQDRRIERRSKACLLPKLRHLINQDLFREPKHHFSLNPITNHSSASSRIQNPRTSRCTCKLHASHKPKRRSLNISSTQFWHLKNARGPNKTFKANATFGSRANCIELEK
jgi:hypothetical protein